MLDGRRDAQPGVVRHDVDGAAGREAHPRHAAQEPHRPRGVPGGVADRGGVRAHAGRPLQRPGPRPRSSASPPSGRPRRSCSACSPTSAAWRDRRQAAGLPTDRPERRVRRGDPRGVGQVRQLLRRRDAQDPDEAGPVRAATRTTSRRTIDENTIAVGAVLGHDPHRRGRPDRGDQRPARADQGREGLGHPAARRRGERRVHRPVRRARPALGLPPRAGGVDQRVRATSTAWSTRASAG